ncbi:CoH1 [Coprinopsis cinerea okayama7|uniref:Hydrophobin n=1 Tax=Coprinopsis cinerea (strain Okayama-7 / 130 / ATCC MYA-4618 / FGSC 9003) TaxID=240176 RepID=A8NKG7_COPC7|nr:CoH1 [Coprinopsis cinerea okayama7\|eukprot:XP_001834445.1 CoH1 [Coprinopsis cinerea okayama7\
MQFKVLSTLALLAATAAAGPLEARQGQCNTGPVQCCNSISTAKDPATSLLLGLLGIVVQDLNIPIGLTCSPISVIGLPGNSCSTQPVCCEDNSFNGVVAIGCTPININV